MNKNGIRWWRDPRFLIPGVAIPIAIALIGVLPSYRGETIADDLVVSFQLQDARRSDASVFDRPIFQQFRVSEESGTAAARAIVE